MRRVITILRKYSTHILIAVKTSKDIISSFTVNLKLTNLLYKSIKSISLELPYFNDVQDSYNILTYVHQTSLVFFQHEIKLQKIIIKLNLGKLFLYRIYKFIYYK